MVVVGGQVIGRGANQAALQSPRLARLHQRGWCLRHLLGVKSGTKYWLCPGCANFTSHAEVRAMRQAQSRHGDIAGADLYLWGHWWCCRPCWTAMIAAGIKDVYLLEGGHRLFHGSRQDRRNHERQTN